MTSMMNLSKEAQTYLECIDTPVDYKWLKDSPKEYRTMVSLYESGMMTYWGVLTEKGEKALRELRENDVVGGSQLKRVG